MPNGKTIIPSLPGAARRLLDVIRAAGGRGWLVGGALRDLLLGTAPKDWDFATTLTPEQLLGLLPGAKPVGGVYGTVAVPFTAGHCEITPCRTEGAYSDHRHPDSVAFVPDILADLARRDFTVNAMAFDGQVLLDPFGGQADLDRKLLRCVGDAKQRFEEDALRVLRLFRLAAQLGFTAEWDTFSAAGDAMDSVAALPRERVAGEVRRMLCSRGPQVLSGIIAKGGLRSYGLEFAPSLEVLARVPAIPYCRWWALIALCGAAPGQVAAAFGLSRRLAAAIDESTRLYRIGPATDKVALKQKLSRTQMDYAPLAETFAAVSPAFAAEPALLLAVRVGAEPYRLEDLAVDGDMLALEGFSGKVLGRVLDELLAAVIKNPALNQVQVLLGLARGLKQLF